MSDLINISICVSDIPKEAIKQATNGKKYLGITVSRRKEVGKYGETHTVAVAQSKEERQAKAPKVYIGSAWEVVFEPQQHTPTADQLAEMPSAKAYDPVTSFQEENDLPF